jgi:hypothetical protein
VRDEWVEIASVPLPDSMANLSDEELEELRLFIENECNNELVRLIDGE